MCFDILHVDKSVDKRKYLDPAGILSLFQRVVQTRAVGIATAA